MADILIRPYTPSDAKAFHDINVDWIGRYFVVEQKDRDMLEAPDGYILGKGGAILMAELDGACVGCVALIPIGPNEYELAKMGVLPVAQGKGAGRKLVAGAIEAARGMGARRLYIETNSVLEAARKLYADAGFRPLAQRQPSPYARADVQLELFL